MSVKKATVYIVDDDDPFRKSLKRLIRALDFEVTDFNTAEGFLEQTHIQRPSCLVLDVNLPRLDGLALQDQLASKGVHIPIIFMTGQGNIPMSVHAMKKGALDFLPKPFSSDSLKTLIYQAVELDEHRRKRKKPTGISSHICRR